MLLSQKLVQMASVNPSRSDFMERFERLIERYNAASLARGLFLRGVDPRDPRLK